MEDKYKRDFYLRFKAILFVIIAYISIAMMSVFVKVATVHLPSTEVLFARFFIGLLFLLSLIPKAKDFSFKITNVKMSLLRNLSGLIGMFLLFYTLKYIPVAMSVLLLNTSSLFIPLLIFLLFRQKTSILVLVCILFGFVGVAIILVPSSENASVFYLLVGLLGAIFAALAYIGIKELSKHDSPLQIVFYFYLMSSIIIPIFAGYDWLMPSWYEFFLLVMVGLFGLMFQLFMSYALKYASITLITPFIFTSILFATILDWLIWKQSPSVSFWIGTIIIVSSISVLVKVNKG